MKKAKWGWKKSHRRSHKIVKSHRQRHESWVMSHEYGEMRNSKHFMTLLDFSPLQVPISAQQQAAFRTWSWVEIQFQAPIFPAYISPLFDSQLSQTCVWIIQMPVSIAVFLVWPRRYPMFTFVWSILNDLWHSAKILSASRRWVLPQRKNCSVFHP